MLMSDILASIYNDLSQDMGRDYPPHERQTRLFNEVQRRIAIELECVECQWETVVQPYSIVSGTCGEDTSSTEIYYFSDDIAADTDFNGYIFRNTTTLASAKVIKTTNTVGEKTVLTLDHSINASEDDLFTLELESRYVDCPWYIIRPYLDEGVLWNETPLVPISFSRQNSYQNSVASGTPNSYAIENVNSGVCRIHVYPRPAQAGVLRVAGPRRTADCFYGATTDDGASDGSTIVSTNIPKKPTDYYVGADIFVHSGTYLGSVGKVSQYTPASDTFKFGSVFGGQIVSAVNIELMSGLGDEFSSIIDPYIRWKVCERKVALAKLGTAYKAEHEDEMDRLKTIYRRRNTANVRINPSIQPRVSRYIITDV